MSTKIGSPASTSEARERAAKLEAALSAIPVFPLPQVVLFPHAMLPLHVFEPRYRRMLADCLAEHGAMVVAQLAPGEDAWGRPAIASIAGGGVIVSHDALPDGRSNILLAGVARLALEELAPVEGRPYRVARATIVEDEPVRVSESDRTALAAAASMFASEVRKHDTHFSFRMPEVDDAGRLADLCAYQLVVDAGVRQAVLEERDPRQRVAIVLNQLALQHTAIRDEGPRVLN